MPKLAPRGWQTEALAAWGEAGHRGIVSVVTGGGKTVFALACIDKFQPVSTLIVVPTAALLEQWWEEAANYFDLALDEVNILDGRLRFKLGAINIGVINTVSKLSQSAKANNCLLIVDECHKAAAPQFRAVLLVKSAASLGLSATPERPYDEGLTEVLVPALGPVIFDYGYTEALRDGVIVPFDLKNIVFDLEPDRQAEYDRLSKGIARSISRFGFDAEETVALYLKRARVLNLSENRIKLALKLIAKNSGRRILVFHEDIEACELIHEVLVENNVRSGIYHSKMPLRARAEMLTAYRAGKIDVLVTCRALDEGFNVPETEMGIIAASTATSRQRIQRLGRVLRPSAGKERAAVYTLAASDPEVARLKDEEARLDGIAEVTWSRA